MARDTKVRTRMQEGQVEILVLVTHPMETGLRKDKDTGKVIPAHFIQDVTLEINGKVAAEAKLGIAVSENPLLGFRFKPEAAKNGSKLKVSWKDNKGESSVVEAVVEV
jgi:sulfur-oxidizing protein SoxZ